MRFLPELYEGNQTRTVVDAFGGYNHNLKIAEGEWYDAENLSSDSYPLFSQRKRRGVYRNAQLGTLNGIIAKDALAWVEGNDLFYNGIQVSLGDVRLTDGEKQLVSMGAYLCIFPDGVYVNTSDLSDCGTMAASYTSVSGAAVRLSPCRVDGTEYDMSAVSTGAAAPEEPANGDYWLDTSGDVHSLKQYSAASGMWVQIPTVYTKIQAAGVGMPFEQYDGVTISGIAGDDAQLKALNGDFIIQAKGTGYIIVVGLLDKVHTQTTQITVERRVPKLDYVCEANNRLWGCFYGMSGGEVYNEIYACKLGDFKNWNCFMGLSTDSYRVSVGSDGPFTGCIAHLGYPLFFKENCIHKIYGSSPSSFQLQTTACRGVQRGSHRSLAIVDEILYYKSRTDVCAYDGSLPAGVSPQLGDALYYDACAGAHGGKYYISMRDGAQGWHMFVYDVRRGLWHREDGLHASGFASWGDELYCIDAGRNRILALNGTEGEKEGAVSWRADSGIIGYELIDRKYVSHFNLRMRLAKDAVCELYIEYDSDGFWSYEGSVRGGGLNAFVFPVIPRRCDHFRIRLKGRGDVKLYSMAKILEQGSDAV